MDDLSARHGVDSCCGVFAAGDPGTTSEIREGFLTFVAETSDLTFVVSATEAEKMNYENVTLSVDRKVCQNNSISLCDFLAPKNKQKSHFDLSDVVCR
jgi:hypothetical protein